jgi:hypothetical protein
MMVVMANRRFVFLVSKTGDTVLDGASVEIRAETAEEAIGKTATWRIVEEGAALTLIGERKGVMSDQRFTPFVAIERIPMHVVQNERFCKTDEPKRLARLAEVAA